MDALLLTLLLLALLVGAVALVRMALRDAIPTRETVWDWEPALLVQDGKIARRLPAGRHRVTPTPIFGSQRVILRLPAGEQTVTTSAQEILTGDTLQVKAVGTLRYEVADPDAAVGAPRRAGRSSATAPARSRASWTRWRTRTRSWLCGRCWVRGGWRRPSRTGRRWTVRSRTNSRPGCRATASRSWTRASAT